MPIATPEKYAEMLDAAKKNSFAFPAINVSSSQTLNAALQGFADAGSDGIIQVSTGGAEYFSGPTIKNMVTGSVAFAAYAAEVAKNYPINVALHTDHCPKGKLDGFVRPLLEISAERVARGEAPLFQSHMWDGSAVPLEENLEIAQELLAKCAAAHIILEVEIGVVGGEEDGVVGEINDKLYTTPADALATVAALGAGENGRYMTALTFGNVHGVYKPGNVKLRGVVKMNIDTDTQYAFTRPVATHMFQNYDGVLKIDGEVGNKKMYDPRAWGKAAEAGMAARVVEACQNLRAAGHSIG
ncbi:class II fructose-bisphosphate aldolase [Nocardioides sp.]|uniref:class II fructose-bisphosphate aldolase n=1 Tax=Nocardioides sp. TaxID=35761 RepID=UPI0025EB49CF|nr:class II fructose-bisphosphate aldolase [Nocardioides sp.]